MSGIADWVGVFTWDGALLPRGGFEKSTVLCRRFN